MPNPEPRSETDLINASRTFAREDRARSWREVALALSVLALGEVTALAAPAWPLRLVAGVFAGLVWVRVFILYHDHLHGALLRGSRAGAWLFRAIGIVMLSPPQVWSESHNAHHAQTARLGAPPAGTFSLWTVERWRAATPGQKIAYRLERNPLTILFGYLTIFLFGMGLIPLVSSPRRHAGSGLSIAIHVAMWALAFRFLGASACATGVILPFGLAFGFGSYLFYAQHNAPGIVLREPSDWSYAGGALDGSTYLATGPVLRWFTGNIGYHHVHHLNARIAFYRLPEVMAALPELQRPVTTTLRPRDVYACLRLSLWDTARGRLVSFGEAARDARRAALAGGAPVPRLATTVN
jgi:omega-6 fatty acid desaturase (delta-12 desaturase)